MHAMKDEREEKTKQKSDEPLRLYRDDHRFTSSFPAFTMPPTALSFANIGTCTNFDGSDYTWCSRTTKDCHAQFWSWAYQVFINVSW